MRLKSVQWDGEYQTLFYIMDVEYGDDWEVIAAFYNHQDAEDAAREIMAAQKREGKWCIIVS